MALNTTLVFLPGKYLGWRSLAGYSPWDRERAGQDLATKQQHSSERGETPSCRRRNWQLNIWRLVLVKEKRKSYQFPCCMWLRNWCVKITWKLLVCAECEYQPRLQYRWKSKWKSLSHVRLFETPWTVVHGILQARILEGVAFSCSRGSSQPRDQT